MEQRLRFEPTRTAGFAEPLTVTWPIPSICDSDCCSTVDAESYSFAGDEVSDVSDTIMIGESAGLTLR